MHRFDDARLQVVSSDQRLLSAISIHRMLESSLPRKQPCLDLPFGCRINGLVQDSNSLFVLICTCPIEGRPYCELTGIESQFFIGSQIYENFLADLDPIGVTVDAL